MVDFRNTNQTINLFVNKHKLLVDKLVNQDSGDTVPSNVMFLEKKPRIDDTEWREENKRRFLDGTTNKILSTTTFSTEYGFVTAMEYDPTGHHIVVGYSTGMIQIRDGFTGVEQRTMRAIEFPYKPIYALQFNREYPNICYAACCDGNVYQILLPEHCPLHGSENLGDHIISAQHEFWTHTKNIFYFKNSTSKDMSLFLEGRSEAYSLSLTSDNKNMLIGFYDATLKIVDMETLTMKKRFMATRVKIATPGLKRVHDKAICALKAHPSNCFIFATASWDQTIKIWDTRCKVGCMATYEGINVHADSIDLNDRNLIVCGSWKPYNALSLFDIRAKKCLNHGRIQNRFRDVDGEYLYACRFWKSEDYNRKGKYALIGGSGTKALEVINLHNRYIACSFPAIGSILAVASHAERIAYAGTKPYFNIAEFHEPKHENDKEVPYVAREIEAEGAETERDFENFELDAEIFVEGVIIEGYDLNTSDKDLQIDDKSNTGITNANESPVCEKGENGECL